MGTAINTKRPAKGDLVKGHCVAAFFSEDLPAIRGCVVSTSPTGHRVSVDFGDVGRLSLRKKTADFTWRRSTGSYQDANDKTRNGAGLALVTGER